MSKLCSAYFSSNGSWTAPAGVTKAIIIGQGGGQGGSGGRNATGDQAFGGVGTTPYAIEVSVVPNTSYAVTIGLGGTGGVPRTAATQNGGTGGSTTFGALYSFSGGVSGFSSFSSFPCNGFVPVTGANGSTAVVMYHSGFEVRNSQTTGGLTVSSYQGGGTGAPGYAGSVPGTGGNGVVGTGVNGGNASGFGAGGGGAGAGTTGGTGGNGAPGQLWVIWVE